jgi:hypothetical protein
VLILLSSPWLKADVYRFPENDWHGSVELGSQSYSLSLKDDQTGRQLRYVPNVGGVVRPEITYQDWLSLSWTFNSPLSEDEKVLRGHSDFTDIRLGLILNQFVLDAHYSQFHGFYLENTQEYFPSAVDSLLRPDLYVRSMGVNFTWVWSPENFSVPALRSQNERQESWGGSWLLGGSLTEHNFRNDSSLVPLILASEFSFLATLRGARYRTLAVKGGYGYSMGGRWFLGGALQVGPGLSLQDLKLDGPEGPANQTRLSLQTEVLIGGGFNGDFIFVTLSAMTRQEVFSLGDSRSGLTTELLTGNFKVGVHL